MCAWCCGHRLSRVTLRGSATAAPQSAVQEWEPPGLGLWGPEQGQVSICYLVSTSVKWAGLLPTSQQFKN